MFYGTALRQVIVVCVIATTGWGVHRIDQIMGAGASLTPRQPSERCARLTSQWAAVVAASPSPGRHVVADRWWFSGG